jgi:V-type H+-transporting ATPase subunit D
LCRLKKVQGKKKRDAEKAEAAKRLEEDAGDGIDTEAEAVEEPPTKEQAGDLLNDKDEDVIF